VNKFQFKFSAGLETELMRKIILFITLTILSFHTVYAQIPVGEDETTKISYIKPQEYEIAGITLSGAKFLDNVAIINLTGLVVGDTIQVPGEKISNAIKQLWKQGLFDHIEINIARIQGSLIFLDIAVKERPRLSRFSFSGIKKSEADEIREKIKLVTGKVVNENLINTTKEKIAKYYSEKGFLNAQITITEKPDTIMANSVLLKIDIQRKQRVKIHKLTITGNKAMKTSRIKRLMKETKQKGFWKIFTTSKFQEKTFEEDQVKVIEKYNQLGYRDAKVVRDTMYRYNTKSVNVELDLYEGPKYYFGNITFIGNTKYSTDYLNGILGIKKGDIYDKKVLDTRLNMNQNGRDIASLYLDDGYLFFNVTPVEKLVYNDTIDLDIVLREGPQATIDRVTVKGNEKTNDKIIIRELRTKPGQKFSRSDIIRTQRELSQLGYFDPEKLGVSPKPNPQKGTVDIEYQVQERPSDQIELSGGFGGGRAVGSLGLSLNNISLRDMMKGKFDPLPTGDGQRLSLRVQTNGLYYQSYSFSFSEPWLGGRRPNYFTASIYRSTQSNGIKRGESGRTAIAINGISFSLGRRLKWPDDYFTINHTISFQQYDLNNYSNFIFENGKSYNISYTTVFARNSVDQPIYPRSGSNISLTIQVTPPYSLFSGLDYSDISAEKKYEFIEYHKWKFDASFYTRIVGNLVLNSKAQFGFLGFYNPDIGISPFERFTLGGDGLTGYNYLTGSEVIGLRGYANNSVIPYAGYNTNVGSPIFNKFTLELRHPITLNQQATIYGLVFIEGGNTYAQFADFAPFGLKRSAGAGVRIFLPIFGMLGLDYGYGFDEIPGNPGANRGQFHFSIGQQF
jgi:outer membrane protein insertion porin family